MSTDWPRILSNLASLGGTVLLVLLIASPRLLRFPAWAIVPAGRRHVPNFTSRRFV